MYPESDVQGLQRTEGEVHLVAYQVYSQCSQVNPTTIVDYTLLTMANEPET